MSGFLSQNWSQFKEKRKRKSDMISLANRTAVKYIQILRQILTHNTQRERTPSLFATTRKLNKKHTHFL